MKKIIASRLIKKNWHIHIQHLEGFIQIEVMDPHFVWVDVDELLIKVIDLIFRECNLISVSQFVDRSQWNIGDKNRLQKDMVDNLLLPVVFTSDFESLDPVKEEDDLFVMHLIGRPDYKWLRKVIGFGMDSNPNILYGLQAVTKDWPNEIIEWNLRFKKWFRLEVNDSRVDSICEEVDLLGWTADGHVNIRFAEGKMNVDRLLGSIEKLAEANSLLLARKLAH